MQQLNEMVGKDTVMANTGSITGAKITEEINCAGGGGVLHNEDNTKSEDAEMQFAGENDENYLNDKNGKSPAEPKMNDNNLQKMEAANY